MHPLRVANIKFSKNPGKNFFRSKELRVTVVPDCAGETNTAWYFTLSCPSPCKKDEVGVKLMRDGVNEIKANEKVFITKDAQMPSLTAYYCSGSSTPPQVHWTFTIETTPGKSDRCSKTTLPGDGALWEIKSHSVQGGDATLSWKADEQSGSLKFKILPDQPDKDDVVALIRKSTSLWYALAVAEDESGFRQFDNGYPYRSSNNGYGIFQLTNYPLPTCSETWNWKDNVAGGVDKLKKGHSYGIDWMRRQRQTARSMGLQ